MTAFTETSPTAGGSLPENVTKVGGIVLDIVGVNGARVVSQTSASDLFNGFFDSGLPVGFRGDPGTIGKETGFDASVLSALGGAIQELAIRITLFDGDTAPGNFDDGENTLLVNGINFGDFSAIVTEQTDPTGVTPLGTSQGFGDNVLHTGWFHVTDTATLAAFFTTLSSGEVVFALDDIDPFDNFFDFTQGVAGSLLDVGSPPNILPTANDDTVSGVEDTPVVINVLDNDNDPDGEGLSIQSATDGANGTTTVNEDGTITYMPNADFNGSDTFTYTIVDDDGGVDSGLVSVNIEDREDAPFANDDTVSGIEDTPLTIDVLDNDGDPEGEVLFAELDTEPNNGTLRLNEDGTFTYTPDLNFNGSDSFTYRASEGGEGLRSELATVFITIAGRNDAPVAADDSVAGVEDTPLDIDVLDNDRDVDGDDLTAVIVSGPTNGSLAANEDGTFTYTPDADFNGSDTFTYRASEGGEGLQSEIATVTIAVASRNDAPVAADDSVAGVEDTPIDIDVLDNDRDVDGDDLTAVIVSGPTNGSLAANEDGTFTYTPDADFNGSDSFTYRASEGGEGLQSEIATVTIAVAGRNDAPVGEEDLFTGNEDSTLTGNVLDNDSDVDRDSLTAAVVSGATGGEFTLDPDGTFRFTPTANTFGTRTFTYVVQDAETESAPITATLVVLPVNDAPTGVDDSFAGDEDTTLTGNVLSNDIDVDSKDLTARLIEGPGDGEFSLSSDGSFEYTPDADANGMRTFTYVASDGVLESDVTTVTLTIDPVNDAPEGNDDTFSGDEDTTLTGNVLTNDSDIEGGPLTAVLLSAPSNGAFELSSNGDFSYTPDPNTFGSRAFTYVASDGEQQSDVVTVALTVNPLNDAPVGEDDTVRGDEDTPIAGNVLANDSDVDDTLLEADVVDEPANGTVVLQKNGQFIYTPDTDFFGRDSFTYIANDGERMSGVITVTVTVDPVNDAPTANDDAGSGNEDAVLTGRVLDNDEDIDSADLTAKLVTEPEHGSVVLNEDGSFAYTPDPDFAGTDRFTYAASDGELTGNTATVRLTIAQVNDRPTAQDDVARGDEDTVVKGRILDNDTDIDSEELTAELETEPENGTVTLNSNGTFDYVPNRDFNGVDQFRYRAQDGELESTPATVTIIVDPVNDAPSAKTDAVTGDEDTTLSGSVLSNDDDADEDALTAILVKGPATGSLDLRGDGTFDYTPDADANGTVTFTYEANDGEADSAVTTVTLTINPVNDRPIGVDDAYASENSSFLGNVLANDRDVDGDELTAILVSGPQTGELDLQTDGYFTYNPGSIETRTEIFTYRVSDGQTTSAPVTVTLLVNPLNDRPIAVDDRAEGSEDNVISGNVLANDTDADEEAITAVLVSQPENGTVTLNEDGTFNYRPNADFNGVDSFTYRADDGTIQSIDATVSITVRPVNDAPRSNADRVSGNEDGTLRGDVLRNDIDVDGDAFTAQLVNGPKNGDLTLDRDGDFVYRPDPNFNGTDTFTYRAADSQSSGETTTVTLTVNPRNDAPEAGDETRTVAEDRVLIGNVLNNDSDIDGDTLSAIVVSNPKNGTLSLNSDGRFTYTPDPDFHGRDIFSYRANDGTASSNVGTVAITVTPRNDVPDSKADQRTVQEDGRTTGNVLSNDRDVDGDPLTAVLVSGPANGTVSLDENGSYSYRPDADFAGSDSFTYRAHDGKAFGRVTTVSLDVVSVSDTPTARNDSGFEVAAGDRLTIGPAELTENDSDGDAEVVEALAVTKVDQATGGTVRLAANGNIIFTADDGVSGTGGFRYTLTDSAGLTDTARVSVEIEPKQVFSDVSLELAFNGGVPQLIYDVEGEPSSVTTQFTELGDPLDTLPISITAEDSDDGTAADYILDPDQFGGLFGPDFVDETRVTPNGIAIVDGQDFAFSDSANTIEGDEALLITFDDTAVIGSAGAARVDLNGVSGDERVRAQIFDDGALVGTFFSNGNTLNIDTPDGVVFDTVRLNASGNTDFTFEGITLFEVFERPVLEI